MILGKLMPRWAVHTWIIVGGAPCVAECLFSGLQDHDILLVNRKGDQVPPESQSKISFFLTLPNRTRYFGEVLQSIYFCAKRDENTYTLLNQKLLFSPSAIRLVLHVFESIILLIHLYPMGRSHPSCAHRHKN